MSIDERIDGTYLIFKDPQDREPRYEILVTGDQTLSDDYEIPVWNVPDPVSVFLIKASDDVESEISEPDKSIQNGSIRIFSNFSFGVPDDLRATFT